MNNNDNYLIHFGVKGMHWGVRRKQKKAEQRAERNKWRKTDDWKYDSKMYGKRGADRIQKRMKKGKSHTRAQVKEFVGQTAATLAITDVLSGGVMHKSIGRVITNKYSQYKVDKLIPKITQNSKFNPIDVPFKEVL